MGAEFDAFVVRATLLARSNFGGSDVDQQLIAQRTVCRGQRIDAGVEHEIERLPEEIAGIGTAEFVA